MEDASAGVTTYEGSPIQTAERADGFYWRAQHPATEHLGWLGPYKSHRAAYGAAMLWIVERLREQTPKSLLGN